jgi:hypothetical protein
MSQHVDDNTAKTPESLGLEDQDGFDSGFDLPDDEDENEAKAAPSSDDEPAAQADNGQQKQVSLAGQEDYAPQQFSAHDTPPATPQHVQEEPPAQVSSGDHIKEEFERLQRLGPQAAALALEDSPEGEIIRQRLESIGAESAEDKASFLLMGRERQTQEASAARQAVEAHNKRFVEVLQREVPEYCKLFTNPERQAEGQTYIKNIKDWIASKTYAEGARLMAIAERGRDPVELADLIKRFESERKGKPAPSRPDPTGALAVRSRGAPPALSGIGDKDNFDAGFYQ